MYKIDKMPDILKKYCKAEELFDGYRIVDPQTNQIYDYDGVNLIPHEELCFEIWGQSSKCINCTSNRAVTEKSQIVKLEYMEKEVFLVFSIPVELDKMWYVLECMKNVTTSMTVNSIYQKESSSEDITELIQHFNELLVRDTFTKFYNKNYAYQKLPELVTSLNKEGGKLTVVVLDIDHFKDVNDTYGHIAGDNVILEIVKTINQYIDNNTTWAVRMGGDEFLIICEGHPPDEVAERCKSLEAEIANICFEEKGIQFHVSASFGKATYMQGESANTLLDRADQNMYEKKHGKKIH